MNSFKPLTASRIALFLVVGALAVLVAWPLSGSAQDKPTDPAAHKHGDKAADADATLAEQVRELQAKIVRLEAALNQGNKGTPPATAATGGMAGKPSGEMRPMGDKGGTKPGMEGMDDAAKKMDGMGADKKPPGGMGMMDMDKKKGMGAMGGDKAGMMDQEMMKMMQMMQQMMEMKMKMMSGMPDMKDMKDMQTPGMKGMEMGTKGMEMGMKGREMMGGKGMAGMQTAAALPAFPGALHIYHTGSTGFFLDQTEHIKLTTEQQTVLNQAKEKGLLELSSFQRKIDDAEQEMETLTSSDKPDATKIDAKVREIEKLRGDQRLAFIRAVGEAAKVLTDDQRKALPGAGADKAANPDPHAGHKH